MPPRCSWRSVPSTARRRSASRCRSTSSGRWSTVTAVPAGLRDRLFRADRGRRRAGQQRGDRGGRRIPGPRRDPGHDRAAGRGRRHVAAHRGEDLDHVAAEPDPRLRHGPDRRHGPGRGRVVAGRSRRGRRRAPPRVRGDGDAWLGVRVGSSCASRACPRTRSSCGGAATEPDPRGAAPGAWFGIAIAATYLGWGRAPGTTVARWALDRRPGDGKTAVADVPSVQLRLGRARCGAARGADRRPGCRATLGRGDRRGRHGRLGRRGRGRAARQAGRHPRGRRRDRRGAPDRRRSRASSPVPSSARSVTRAPASSTRRSRTWH